MFEPITHPSAPPDPAPNPEPDAEPDPNPDRRTGADPSVLDRILDGGVGIAIWRREPSAAVRAELAALDPGGLRDLRVQLPAEALAGAWDWLLREGGLDPARLPAWCADLADLAARFAALLRRLPGETAPPLVTVRVEALTDDGCPRFHVDRTRLRLLCTEQGPGTEYLTEAQVDRAALYGHAPNAAILRAGSPQRLATHWVAVLKGECFPADGGRGLVHRSPPIAGSATTRLLVCLDA